MGFLVDTNLWVAVERGKLSAADVFAVTKTAEIYISPVNLAELQLGVEFMDDPASRYRAMTCLKRLKKKPLLKIDAGTADVFAQIAAVIRRSGKAKDYRVQDLWLAAQAIQRDFGLLTNNKKDFIDIPGLQMIEFKL